MHEEGQPGSRDAAGSTPSIRPGWGVLLTTATSTFVVYANTTAVNILIPVMSVDLGAPINVLQWAVTGYLLVGAAVIITSGVLGDVLGRRRVFLHGLALFVVSGVVVGMAGSSLVVVVGRLLQGAAGATVLASALSLLSATSSGAAQMKAVTYWGAAASAGAAAGPVLGGVLNAVVGWQGLFWIDAAVAAACLPVARFAVPESRDPTRPRKVDVAGTVLVAAVLVPFVFAVTEGHSWGWLSAPTLTCLVASVLAAVAFVVVERRVAAPLLDLGLLRNSLLVGATSVIMIASGAISGLSLLVSLYFQQPETLGMTSLQAGLAMLPVPAVGVLLAPMVTPLAHYFGTRPVVVVGFAILTAAFVLFAGVHVSWTYAAIAVPLFGVALGLSLTNGPSSTAATASVGDQQVGVASGISNMARYVGGAIMTPVVTGIYARVVGHWEARGAAVGDALAAGLSRASVALAVFSAAGVVIALLVARRPPRPRLGDYAATTSGTVCTLPIAERGSP